MKTEDMEVDDATTLSGLKLSRVPGTLILPGQVVGTLTAAAPPPAQSPAASAGGRRGLVVRVGSGVTQRGDRLQAVKGGRVSADVKRNKVWVFHNQRRYQASVDDLIIGIVQEKHSDDYRLDINGMDTAVLGQLAFEGASKKNKPNLVIGSAVFCRVVHATKHTEPQVSCVEPGSARSWTGGETLYGELKHGNVVHVSLALANSMVRKHDQVLSTLGKRVAFQSAVGVNGRVWIQTAGVKQTVVVSDAIVKADVMEKDEWLQYVDKLFKKSLV